MSQETNILYIAVLRVCQGIGQRPDIMHDGTGRNPLPAFEFLSNLGVPVRPITPETAFELAKESPFTYEQVYKAFTPKNWIPSDQKDHFKGAPLASEALALMGRGRRATVIVGEYEMPGHSPSMQAGKEAFRRAYMMHEVSHLLPFPSHFQSGGLSQEFLSFDKNGTSYAVGDMNEEGWTWNPDDGASEVPIDYDPLPYTATLQEFADWIKALYEKLP